MKRLTAALLLLFLCLPLAHGTAALAEVPPMPPSSDALLLPDGVWVLDGSGKWSFNLDQEAILTPAQAALAREGGLPVTDQDTILAGTTLSSADLFLLYPGAEGHYQLPLVEPNLEMFNLTGEWYYGDDDVLYYKHGDEYAVLTVDEVFAKLQGSRTPTSADEKIIYLTIDDTPSTYTMELLSVLDRNDVKATFFVVGAYVSKRPVFVRAMHDQGHVIANHSYSHDASVLSSSLESCLRDFRRCEQAVADALGFALDMPIVRVPYGSSTIPLSYRTAMQEQGYMWIDWNALNGDTESDITTDEAVINRAISTASRYDGAIVMLVHDKAKTVRTLEAVIQYFHEAGYEFRTLSTNIEKIPGVRTGMPK